MKSLIVISLFGFSAAAANAEALPMRDAATHTQLAVTHQKASQQDPMLKQTPAKGPDPSKVNRPESLLGASDIICFNGAVTLVPKRAILQMPKNLVDRLKYQPGAKVLSWAEFYALNRGWITTVEVSRVQAEGNSPLPEETTKMISKSGNLIVATYQAGPISVLPLKQAPAANTTPAATAKPAATTTPAATTKPAATATPTPKL